MELKIILNDQKVELEKTIKTRTIIEREVEKYFKNPAKSKLIKITTGIRRAGKSIFTSLMLKNEKFGYVNFDDERLLSANSDDIYSALLEIHGKELNVLFFDEIQNLDNWELFVNRLKRAGFNIFITGSNAKMLSRDLATHLTGRHIAMELFPFSFREYLKAINFDESLETTRGIALVKHELKNYMLNSGFPEIVVEKEEPGIYLMELYRKIVERDIIIRYNINYKKTFREIAMSVISNPGRQISYNKIKKQFNLGSDHTVKNYLSYMEEAYIIFLLNKFSYKPKEIQRSEKKCYVIDTGFVNHAGIQFKEDSGHFIENIVAVELFRRRAFRPQMEIYYWKNYQQEEVDFLIREDLRVKQLIQVCYNIENSDTKKRELRSLLKASDELKCNYLLVITWSYEAEEMLNGKKIKFVPLWKWLIMG
ncbi:MAG: ATP-binding protein [Candidatus Aenigmarchaeota archaeon]|nr:ATP-binding protein [Candidatus Aenigmarchaeota archaeon]